MRNGFTLIELMTVLILGTSLLMIAWPNYTEMGKREKEAQVKINMYMLQQAAEDFTIITEGIYASDCGNTVGQVRTLVYGATDPLADDPRSMCGISCNVEPVGTYSLISPMMKNPVTGANWAFQSDLIIAHSPATAGCVGYEAYDRLGFPNAPAGLADSYVINGDGYSDLMILMIFSQ